MTSVCIPLAAGATRRWPPHSQVPNMPNKRAPLLDAPLTLPKFVVDYSLAVDECTLVDGVLVATSYVPSQPPTEVVPCTNPLCHRGGYALAELVRVMAARGVDEEESILCCEGYQLQEHTSGFRCPHFLRVRGTFTYAAQRSTSGANGQSVPLWHEGDTDGGWFPGTLARDLPDLSKGQRPGWSWRAFIQSVRQDIRDVASYAWEIVELVQSTAWRARSASALRARTLLRAALRRAARAGGNLT